MTKTLILDTNVYLTQVSSLFAFGKSDIAIPTIILDEIDKHKQRQDTAGFNARTMNRVLDQLRRKGSLFEGVPLGRGKGKVQPFMRPAWDQAHQVVMMNGFTAAEKVFNRALKSHEGRLKKYGYFGY